MSIELLILLFVPLVLLVIGRIVGAHLERAHYASIAEREARFSRQPALSTKHVDAPAPIQSTSLASGSVVVSIDQFKRFLSRFRMLIGGEVRPYTKLIERARREAILRMKESQPDADLYINTRLETSNISSASGEGGMGIVEVLAYGTAVHYARSHDQ